jgi:hypothetical protein
MKNNDVIRRATKADYDDIISIIPSGEYDGEYLPDYFHILMDNPLYDPFVYILNDNSDLLVEETRVPGENHRPIASP